MSTCGHKLPTPQMYTSSGQYLTIRMHSDFSITDRGFQAHYKSGK